MAGKSRVDLYKVFEDLSDADQAIVARLILERLPWHECFDTLDVVGPQVREVMIEIVRSDFDGEAT